MSIENIGKFCNVADWHDRNMDDSLAIIEGYSEDYDYYILGVSIHGRDYDDEEVPSKFVIDINDTIPKEI